MTKSKRKIANLFFEDYKNIDKNDIKYIDQWLFSQKFPKKLILCQEDMATYYYKAIFKKSEILYHNNKIYGLNFSLEASYPSLGLCMV